MVKKKYTKLWDIVQKTHSKKIQNMLTVLVRDKKELIVLTSNIVMLQSNQSMILKKTPYIKVI